MVLNKVDAAWQMTAPLVTADAVAVSARTGAGLAALVDAIGARLGVARPPRCMLRRRGRHPGLAVRHRRRARRARTRRRQPALTVQADAQLLARLAGAVRMPVRVLLRPR
jgi:50S ribosomal subunit-associated GTPase HflX